LIEPLVQTIYVACGMPFAEKIAENSRKKDIR